MRTKGSKNKPKQEIKQDVNITEVKKVDDNKILDIAKDSINENKEVLKQLEDKPKTEVKIIEKIKEVPKIIYKTKPEKIVKQDPVLIPVKKPMISKKSLIFISFIVIGILVYIYRDRISSKFFEWKSNKIVNDAIKEGVTDLDLA